MGLRSLSTALVQVPPVVVVSRMFCDRQTTHELAEKLAQQFSVINYDRRGRGDGGDTRPYYTVLEGQDHGAPAEVVAPVIADFFTTSSLEAR